MSIWRCGTLSRKLENSINRSQFDEKKNLRIRHYQIKYHLNKITSEEEKNSDISNKILERQFRNPDQKGLQDEVFQNCMTGKNDKIYSVCSAMFWHMAALCHVLAHFYLIFDYNLLYLSI